MQQALSRISARLLSLDVYRGLTMAAMVLVENPGTWPVFRQLEHARWGEPLTFTDWIMPSFLFILGLSITLSLGRRIDAGVSRNKLFQKICVRTIILFGLGVGLHLFYFALFGRFRLPGILQRIALVYFFSALIFLISKWRTQAVILIVLLVGYWIILTVVPVPGVGPANLEPGTNLADWLDQTLIGKLLRNPRSDPQGLLSTIPAVGIGLIGLLAGHWLRRKDRPHKKTLGFLVAGILLIVLGKIWSLEFPMIREIWTSSYVLYTTGFALCGWGVCYWLVDVRKWTKGWTKPLAAYGTSCIFVFLASHVVGALPYAVRIPVGSDHSTLQAAIIQSLFAGWLTPQMASLLFACAVVLLWLIPLWIMYSKNKIIKI